MDPRQREAFLLDRLTEDLGLDKTQQKQLQTTLNLARTTAKPLQDQMRAAQKAVLDAAKAGKPKPELDRLATQEGVVHGKLAALSAKTFQEVYTTLKPNQRAGADDLMRVITMVVLPRPMMGPPPPREPR